MDETMKKREMERYSMKKRTLEDKFKSVKASLEVEGYVITKEIEELILAEAKGEISFKEMLEKVKKYDCKSMG